LLIVVVLLPCVVLGYAGGRKGIKAVKADDPCFAQPTCLLCIATPRCGWCSTPVVGGNGAQCAGFASNDSKPFVCHGTYQTTTCTPPTTSTTAQTSTTGTGTTGTGTTGTATSTTGPSPVPPVKGFWRGLRINKGFTTGEWTWNFTMDTVDVKGPKGEAFEGKVYSTVTEMDIVITSGDNKGVTLYGIYEQDFGPASAFLSYAISPLGLKYAPSSWGIAMNSESHTVWELEQPKEFNW